MSDQTTMAFTLPKPAPTGSVDLRHGDCLEVLRSLEDNSVDSVVTDPPYGLSNTKPAQVADVLAAWVTGDTEAVPAKKGGFMGKDWDSFVPPPAVWAECLRVLKPGGHMAVFAGARTQDLMGLSIRLAGFEIRDTLGWVYSQGFPKGQDLGKAIDKIKGAKRESAGVSVNVRPDSDRGNGLAHGEYGRVWDVNAPATDEARKWDGWNTQLKPAIEPIILARKPLDGTVAANVLAHGVGGLNIDASRVDNGDFQAKKGRGIGTLRLHGCSTLDELRHLAERGEKCPDGRDAATTLHRIETVDDRMADWTTPPPGRFPANVLLDEHAAAEMDEQSGWQKDGTAVNRNRGDNEKRSIYGGGWRKRGEDQTHGGSGGASRFFPVFKYQAKAPKKERPVIVREDGTKVQHPTVKPLSLMSWIVTLTTPEGGTTLDPFAGTGTTLQAARDKGFNAIGIEQDEDYIQLIGERLGWSAA